MNIYLIFLCVLQEIPPGGLSGPGIGRGSGGSERGRGRGRGFFDRHRSQIGRSKF